MHCMTQFPHPNVSGGVGSNPFMSNMIKQKGISVALRQPEMGISNRVSEFMVDFWTWKTDRC